jgi:small multidrug resistance pump
MKLYWLYLALGIVFEVLGTVCMKFAEGFTKLWPSVLVFVFYGLSLGLLVLVLEKFEVSIAYAIWASLGTALIAVIGILFFNEPVSVTKVVSILLIIAGILGLELFD